MKLYLSSYKLGEKVEELKKWIRENGNNIVLIPNSRDIYPESERKVEGIKIDIDSLKNIGFDVKVIDLKEYFEKSDKLKQELQNYNAFFAIGGNVFALRKAMQLSGFDKFLEEKLNEKDFLYGGYSAGICVLSPNLKALELVDEPVNPYNEEKVNYDGLGFLDYVLIPHYKSNHPESEKVEDVVKYCEENRIKYKTLKDGDVIIKDTLLNKNRECER